MKMERIVAIWLGLAVSEQTSFLIKSGIFLSVCGATLFVALAASYPAVHDTLHNVRHALAVVPCHYSGWREGEQRFQILCARESKKVVCSDGIFHRPVLIGLDGGESFYCRSKERIDCFIRCGAAS